MQKSKTIVILITCIVMSGCSLHLVKWSTQEVAWFSCLLLVLTGCMLFAANRVTLERAGAPSSGIGPVLCLAGLFLLIWGSKLNLINAFGSDVPFWDQWGIEGILYPAVLQGKLHPSLLFQPYNEHRPLLTRLLSIMLLKLDGQWDPIVVMVVDSLLYSLILTGFCLVLWRLAGRKNLPVFCIMIGIIGVLHFSWENTLGGMHSCFYFLLGFSVLAIVLLLCSRPFTISWFLGLAATLFGQFSLSTGFVALLAVACVLLLNCISGTQNLKESLWAIVVIIAVAILGYQLVPVSQKFVFERFDLIGSSRVFGNTAAWPFRHWALAAIVWSPFFILIRNQFRAKETSRLAQVLLALGVWALLQAVPIAWYRGSSASRYRDIHAVGLLANLVITFYFCAAHRSLSNNSFWRSGATWLGAAILVICTAMSALHFKESTVMLEKPRLSGIQEVNTASYVLTGDPSSLVGKPLFHIPFYSADFLMSVLTDPVLRRVLPAGIRAPLAIEPAESLGFSPGAIPPGLPTLPHRRVLGSWSADKGLSRSEYLSNPISGSFRWLVFDVAGGGPGISLEILPSGGMAIPINPGGQSGGWKKVVVEAPRAPFRLHASDGSGHDGWLAFSLPRELAGGGYYIRRILSANLFVLAFGMISLFAGLITLPKENLPLHGSDNPIFPEIPQELP
ncbi:MAG: hypothetical protein ABSF90_02120 [Syntrophobacteraceae bacterium]|jgi:hypothetical protein